MNVKEKGWIKHYLHTRNQYVLHKEFERLSALEETPSNPENFLYQLLQPTGFLYGHPTEFPLQNKPLLRALKIDALHQTDKTKLILLESFLHSALTSPRYQYLENAIDMADATLEATHLIGKFYKGVYQGLNTKYQAWFYYKERTGLDLSEYVLENKAKIESGIGHFWGSFFNASLMFLDIFYFGKWIYAEKSDIETNQIAVAHEQMRLLILELMIAAALANDIIEPEEKKLFYYFVEAAMFSEETQDLCYQYLDHPVPLKELKLQQISSQVLKKYIYELALLVIYADKLLTETEKDFMEVLRRKLGLRKKEVESSQLAVESFMISHWQQIEFLQNPIHLSAIQELVVSKMAAALEKNESAFTQHIQSNQDLLLLLKKVSKTKLSKEEKIRICQGLTAAIKSLPSSVLSTIPKSFFTYPVLMQIIPDKVVLVETETSFADS